VVLLQDDSSQYVKLLSVLEPGDTYPVPDNSILKEKFSRYIVYQTETDSSNCDTVPLTGKKEGALLEVVDKRDCYQYLSPALTPRKRKENPNDIMDLSVFHGAMMEKNRAFLENPRRNGILEVTNLDFNSVEIGIVLELLSSWFWNFFLHCFAFVFYYCF
jgi:hypothetical protein